VSEHGRTGEKYDTPLVDLRFWAKERGLRGKVYPLACHSLDAAAAALVLWHEYLSPGLRETIAMAMETDEEHAGRCIAFWAGLHDIGKLTREFQQQLDMDLSDYPGEELSGERRSHAAATGQWLPFVLSSVGYPDGQVTWLVAQLLGGHHGRFHEHPASHGRNPLAKLGFSSTQWEEQRRALLHVVLDVVGRPGPPKELDGLTAAVVCGLVILADWLVSQEDFILERLGSLPADGSASALRSHFEESKRRIPSLLDAAGLRPITVPPATFTEAFPHISEPNGLQASLAEHLPSLCTGPGLVLITAPMGEGKTEAAYHVADLLDAATGRHGRFLALPTTATADQMHFRFKKYARHRTEGADPARPSTLALLHSMAWLNSDYAPADVPGVSTVLSDGADHRDPFAATEWLMGRKRGLLASWAVGTIDQALMAVLRAKHNALRLFGLAGKVVVVDEAHAVDPYMQILLEQLLRWLGALDTPVVLLSATLHHSIANSLVKAYLEGARGYRWSKSEPQPVPEISYPGWLHADARTGKVTRSADVAPVPIATTPRKPLAVRLVEVPVEKGRPDRSEALHRELTPLVEGGGCAAVICTTVAEAQEVYDLLADWFAERGGNAPELHLLHARFPNRQRTEITETVVDLFGKDGAKNGRRPTHGAVLVATQVVEQSLDLDLDLMVSDIAPVSLLLQRAGRCWRHEHLDVVERPAWAERPELVVLTPEQDAEADGPPRFPRSWQAVYPLSLLQRTHALLRRRDGEPVRIPEDVQSLVDDVYDDDSLAEDLDADLERMGDELAKRGLARNAVIPDVDEVEISLHGLTQFDFDVDEHLLATRFGAGSVRVLCYYVDTAGQRWLDPDCTVELPEKGTGKDGRFTVADCRDLVARTIPVRMGLWFGRLSDANRPPEAWRESFHLRDLVLIPQQVTEEGTVLPTEAGGREWLLDPRKGLVF